jgi:hypothetical protein
METNSEDTSAQGDNSEEIWPPAIEREELLVPKAPTRALTGLRWFDFIVGMIFPGVAFVAVGVLFEHPTAAHAMATPAAIAGIWPWFLLGLWLCRRYPTLTAGLWTGTGIVFGLVCLQSLGGDSSDSCGCLQYVGNTISILMTGWFL